MGKSGGTSLSNGTDKLEMKRYKPNKVASEQPFFTPTWYQHCCTESCLHSVAQTADSAKFADCVRQNSAELNVTDEQGRTALHWVNSIKCSCENCLSQAEECVRSLLNSGAELDVNCKDADGNTPLHLAVKYGNTKVAQLLLANGAEISIKNNENQEVLSMIAQNSPEVMVSVLNQAVSVAKFYPNSKDCILRLDFSAVTGNADDTGKSSNTKYKRELSLLNQILRTSKAARQRVLTHPLIILFLDQKWRRVRTYYMILFFCYLFWLLSYTSFIIKVYLISCPCDLFSKDAAKARSANRLTEFDQELKPDEANRCHLETGFTYNSCTVLLLTFGMAVNEILKIVTTPRLYFRNKLNLGTWVLIAMVIITTAPVIMQKNSKLQSWQYEAAALAIFLSWAFILRQLGTFPSLGRYVEILGHVLKNFSLSMLTFSSLFMAFALALNVLFPGTGSFSHFFYAIMKCIVMFTGEVDYQDMFFDKDKEDATGPVVGHLLYVGFVLIITVVLMNLLVGLTVSDIQALQKEAELTRVFRQISEMLSLESAAFSTKFPRPFNRYFQRMISVTGHSLKANPGEEGLLATSSENELLIKNFLLIHPNDPSDKRVPEHLKDAMLKIAIGNYHQSKTKSIG